MDQNEGKIDQNEGKNEGKIEENEAKMDLYLIWIIAPKTNERNCKYNCGILQIAKEKVELK